jgi:hypothetical protein
MTRAFAAIPMNEDFMPHMQWFEENCPNLFIADCVHRVLKEASINFQLEMSRGEQADTVKLTYIAAEARKAADSVSSWERNPEVISDIQTERRLLALQAEQWGIQAPALQRTQQDQMPRLLDPPTAAQVEEALETPGSAEAPVVDEDGPPF